MCLESYVVFWITGRPLVSFASLVIIPVPKRIVVESAFWLASSVFIQWLLPKAAAWVIHHDGIQQAFLKSLETAKDLEQREKWVEKGRLLDEL